MIDGHGAAVVEIPTFRVWAIRQITAFNCWETFLVRIDFFTILLITFGPTIARTSPPGHRYYSLRDRAFLDLWGRQRQSSFAVRLFVIPVGGVLLITIQTGLSNDSLGNTVGGASARFSTTSLTIK